MEEFIKNYIFSQIEPTTPGNQMNILSREDKTSENFGYSYVQCGDYIVFYENSSITPGMKFYIYDKTMHLVKTENLMDNWINIVGETLKQDENGNFYLLGYMNPEETAQGTTYYSLILLNNIIKETPVIRKWYKLEPLGIGYAFDCQKKIGSADYLFVYQQLRVEEGLDYYDLYLVQFTISVQNGNSVTKWVYKNCNLNVPLISGLGQIGCQYNQEISKILVVFELTGKIEIVLINLDNNWQFDEINELSLGNGIEITRLLDENVHNLSEKNSVLVNGINSFVFIREDTNKVVQYNTLDDFSNPIIATLPIPSSAVEYVINANFIGTIFRVGPEKYLLEIYPYELTENSIEISNKYLLINFSYLYDISEYRLHMSLINTNVYNLNYITFILEEISGLGVAIIVSTDNGLTEYTDLDSLVPEYVNLSNGSIIFSRKLTNESIIGNQMSAEINVPYSMLNDTQISAEQLISKTNKTLSNESMIINKNIYESLYLNFIKHINVIDNNFDKNELQNNISSLLTKSIFSTPRENYEVAPIGYVKTFTKDGQELIFTLGSNSIEQIGENEYLINIAVNGNNVEKIQILAKDRQTPYITIPLYSVDGVILIKQKLIINNTFDEFIMSENNEFIITENNEFIIEG